MNINYKIIKQHLIPIIFLILLVFVIRLPYTNIPLERDEGDYAYGAFIMAAGGVPFRDFVDVKGTLVYFIYRLAFILFGYTTAAIHTMMSLWLMLTVALIYILALKIFSNKAVSFFSCLSFIFLTFKPVYGMGIAALTELYMSLPIALGAIMIFYGVESGKCKHYLLSGIFMGAAFLIKQTSIAEICIFSAFIVILNFKNNQNIKNIVLYLSNYVMGYLAVFILSAVYFWYHHLINEYLYFTIKYLFVVRPLNTVSMEQAVSRLSGVLSVMAKSDWLYWFAGILGLISLFKQKRVIIFCFLISWFLGAASAIFPLFTFSGHYFQQIYLSQSLIAGFGLFAVYETLLKRFNHRLLIFPFTVIVIILSVAPYLNYYNANKEEVSRLNYGNNPFYESLQIADYIKNNTNEKDTLFILGTEPQILFYAKRRSCTRLTNQYVFIDPDKVTDYHKELERDILVNQPKFIIIFYFIKSNFFIYQTESYFYERLPEILKKDYFLDSLVFVSKSTLYFWGPGETKKAVDAGILNYFDINKFSCLSLSKQYYRDPTSYPILLYKRRT
ncbi:MAG: glycosyltransferase family 39 protein [Elusimicrobia bacterium]|nr:glycosyltransferase family 39 protein [Candidatus Liberimonas magnetica]